MRPLLAVAALLVVLFAARIASPVIGPLLLAGVLAIAFDPMTTALTRRGVPRWGAALATTTAILAVVIGISFIVIQAASELVDHLPTYGPRVTALQDGMREWLVAQGFERTATSMADVDAAGRLKGLAEPALMTSIGVVQTLIIVVITVAFIQIDAPGVRDAIRRKFRSRTRVAELDHAIDEIQRYVIVKGLISGANGLLLGLWCWLWGVDAPVLWGVIAFALNFVPIVGSLVSAAPPVLLTLLVAGPGPALGVASGYIAVNLVVDNIIEPRVMGRACGVSPLVILLAMLFWGFVLGPIGALLSVPLVVAVKAMVSASPEHRWIVAFLEDVPAPARATALVRRDDSCISMPLPAPAPAAEPVAGPVAVIEQPTPATR